MNRVILLLSLICLTACATQEKPIEVIPKEKEKLAFNEVTQTLNVKYENLFSLIQQILAQRGIGIAKFDSAAGKLITVPVHVEDKKGSIPLNCDVTLKIAGEPYQAVGSIIKVSYQEYCDGLESDQLQAAESKAEKLMVSVVDDIKSASY